MAFYNEVEDSNFVISFTRDPVRDFGIFARGYHRAARALAESLLTKVSFSDSDAYPVLFLYRHSLELHLKHIIYRIASLLSTREVTGVQAELLNSHELVSLSKKAAKQLNTLFPGDANIRQLAHNIVRISSEFAYIDPISYSYRYPVDKLGSFSTRSNQIVSLAAVHRTLNTLLEEMNVIDFGLDVEAHHTELEISALYQINDVEEPWQIT